MLAGDNRISFQKYATKEDLEDLRGHGKRILPEILVAAAPSRSVARRTKGKVVFPPEGQHRFRCARQG